MIYVLISSRSLPYGG